MDVSVDPTTNIQCFGLDIYLSFLMLCSKRQLNAQLAATEARVKVAATHCVLGIVHQGHIAGKARHANEHAAATVHVPRMTKSMLVGTAHSKQFSTHILNEVLFKPSKSILSTGFPPT